MLIASRLLFNVFQDAFISSWFFFLFKDKLTNVIIIIKIFIFGWRSNSWTPDHCLLGERLYQLDYRDNWMMTSKIALYNKHNNRAQNSKHITNKSFIPVSLLLVIYVPSTYSRQVSEILLPEHSRSASYQNCHWRSIFLLRRSVHLEQPTWQYETLAHSNRTSKPICTMQLSGSQLPSRASESTFGWLSSNTIVIRRVINYHTYLLK